MQKVYSRINWENDPSTNTPINEKNLNKMDYAINVIDDRVVNLQGYQDKAATSAANAKTSEANAKTSETNAKASELLAKQYAKSAFSGTPDGYEQLVEDVSLLDIQTTTSTTLQGSKNGGAKLNYMVGATEQKQYDGRNMFDNSTAVDGYGIGANGKPYVSEKYSYSDYINVTSGNTYSFQNIKWHNVYDADKNAVSVSNTKTPYTIPDDAEYLRLTFVTLNKDIVQMELGDTPTDIEPYVGNAPSPSPEYQQSLNNTGDCVGLMQGYWKDNGIYTNSTEYICSKYNIPCKTGDVIKIKCEETVSKIVLNGYQENAILFSNGSEEVSEYEYTIINGNTTSFNFNIKNTNITPSTVGKISLTVNGKYVGQIVEHGKNILKMSYSGGTSNNITCTDNGDGTYTLNGTATAIAAFPILPFANLLLDIGKTYRLVGSPVESSPVYRIYDSYSNLVSDVGNGGNFTHVGKRINLTIRIASGAICNNLVFKPMLVDADLFPDVTYNDFEPYTEHIATYYTNEPTRDSDRFVQIDNLWNVERNSAEMVFDGTQTTFDHIGNQCFKYTMPNVGGNADENIVSNIMCDSLIADTEANCFQAKADNIISSLGGTKSAIYIRLDSTVTQPSELYSRFVSNPIKVQYPLAQPTYEVLDTESQIALNGLKSFNGATYIEIDSRVQPSEISLDYGTSRVGAMALQATNDNLIDYVERQEMKAELEELRTALVALGSEV